MVDIKKMVSEGRTGEALQRLEREMIEDPKSLELSNYYRQLSVVEKKFEQSINYFKERVAQTNTPNEMYYNLAFAYIDKIPTVGPMGSGFLSKRAIAQFQKVIDRTSNDWVAIYGIGMNYLHWPDYFKKNDSAIAYLEQALNLQQGVEKKPYHILTYIRLGDAYAKSGQVEKAYEVWRAGLQLYPDHPDLADRAGVSPDKIGAAMRDLYNPNNSIGEINTDISVLWVDYVPKQLVPLKKNSLQQAGVGGLVKGAKSKLSEGQIGLFSWFMKNLPFLSDRNKASSVDMGEIGLDTDKSNSNLASVVANGMIMGFMSRFEDDSPQQVRAKIEGLDSFHRPFFHEGLGMGFAATASLDDVSELRKLVDDLKAVDARFTRLHLAGAGMWYGLESSRNSVKVKNAFRYLQEFGEAYAYEGYGFAQTLFYFNNNPELIRSGEMFGSVAARSFYHGAGRALWILNGTNMAQFTRDLNFVPAAYHKDAISGYGMGVAFTKVEEPDFVVSYLKNADRQSVLDEDYFYTGVTMGYVIRNIGEPTYMAENLRAATDPDRCRINALLQIGQDTLSDVEYGGGDLHANWRQKIHQGVVKLTRNKWNGCREWQAH